MKPLHALFASLLVSGSASAADFSFTGNFTNDNEVQEFNFSVAGSPSDVTLRTWSYAGGTNVAGAVISRGGFDPIVTLFDGTGNLISYNDDGHLVTDPQTGLGYDSLLTQNLSAGNYTATLTQFDSFAVGPLLSDGFRGIDPLFSNFDGRDSHWALDIQNVNAAAVGASYVSAVSPVPEPESYALLLAGLGLVSLVARRRLSL